MDPSSQHADGPLRAGRLPPGVRLVVGRFDAPGGRLLPDVSQPYVARRRPAERSGRPFAPGSAAGAAAAAAAEADRAIELAPASGRGACLVGAREALQSHYGAAAAAAVAARGRRGAACAARGHPPPFLSPSSSLRKSGTHHAAQLP
jgi:hypothetical protein